MLNTDYDGSIKLLDNYREYLLSKVTRVRLLGEAGERELKDVFVTLSIVDQNPPQRYLEFLSLMDSAMRRRFNPFARSDKDASSELSTDKNSPKRLVKPDELLRPRTKAIVTGAPGCGKTTLLKYVALQALHKEKRLVVWLELKALDKSIFAHAEKAAARNGNLSLQELWVRQLKVQLSLNNAQTKALREHWQEKFHANAITVLLDGFDEVQDEAIERSLNKCVREFASTSHDNTLLISTRPYAQVKLGSEHLQELEIEPLDKRQIEAFLNCYYPNDKATKSLLQQIRQRPSPREILHVPLLLGVILRLHRENRFKDDELKLYETIILDLVHELDRSKSIIRQFKINDGRLRLDFLKFLAFELLLREQLEGQEAKRLVFSYDLLTEKARAFLAQEHLTYHARDVADDALATPLLREVGANTFAFTHLILQEFLAAHAFTTFLRRHELEGKKLFCRAYHNPVISEMEVLPMILGAAPKADQFYEEIESWPESLTFSNFRIRARGLAYSAKINPDRLLRMIDRLLEFVSEKSLNETPYRELVVESFMGMSSQTMDLIEAKAELLIKPGAPEFLSAAYALGKIGSDKAIGALISALVHEDTNLRWNAVKALGDLGSDRAVDALISALTDEEDAVRFSAVMALGQIDSHKSVDALIFALADENKAVRFRAADVLGELGAQKAVAALVSSLSDKDGTVKWEAAHALAKIGSEEAIDALISALNHNDNDARWSAARALADTGSANAVAGLSAALNDNDHLVRSNAVHALGRIGSEAAISVLISALNHQYKDVRLSVVETLGVVGSVKAINPLLGALNDQDADVIETAARSLGRIGADEAIDPLILAVKHKQSSVRSSAAFALGLFGSDNVIDALTLALADDERRVRQTAAYVLSLLDSDRAVAALSRVLADEDAYVRTFAASALAQTEPDKAVDVLVLILRDKDSGVRWEGIHALAQVGSEKAVDALISVLQHHDLNVKQIAAESLLRIGSEKAVDALITVLQRPDSYMRERAARHLGEIGSEKVVEALIVALQTPDRRLHLCVAEALAGIKSSDLIAGLVRTIKCSDAFARKKVIEIIGYYLSDTHTLNWLRHLAQTDADNGIREAAGEAAKKLAHKMVLLGLVINEQTSTSFRDNESRELYLVGETIKVVAEAGHIFRPTPNSDWGIDGEIEFKDDNGAASGKRVYLQLKSGDSHLRRRKNDGKEFFTVKPRHAKYWQAHAYPVLLVIRNSNGQIRWMNLTRYLHDHGTDVKRIEFQGEPFTSAIVKQMRDTQ